MGDTAEGKKTAVENKKKKGPKKGGYSANVTDSEDEDKENKPKSKARGRAAADKKPKSEEENSEEEKPKPKGKGRGRPLGSKGNKANKTKEKEAKGKKGKKEKDPNKPKKGTTGYFFFMADERAKVKAENEGWTAAQIGKELGARWNKLDDASKKPYLDKAAKD